MRFPHTVPTPRFEVSAATQTANTRRRRLRHDQRSEMRCIDLDHAVKRDLRVPLHASQEILPLQQDFAKPEISRASLSWPNFIKVCR